MRNVHVAFSLVAALFVSVASRAWAECNLADFGLEHVRTCPRATSGCVPSWIPSELQKIEKGMYAEFVGYSINDGLAFWTALDIDRRRLIRIERYAGGRLQAAPTIANPDPNEYLRETKTDRAHWVDHVRVFNLSDERATKLACFALPLWTDRDNLYQLATDVSYSMVLLRGGNVRKHGGVGALRGLAKEAFDTLSKQN